MTASKITYFTTLLALIFVSHAAFSQVKYRLGNSYKFESKLKKEKDIQVISWTEKSTYKIGEPIFLFVESNRMFDKSTPFNFEIPNLEKRATERKTTINKGIINTCYLVEYFAKAKGRIEIPSIKFTIDKKQYVTKKIKLKIKK